MERMLSVRQFADAIGISQSSVRRLADRGVVETYRTQGGHRKIPLAEALRYVRQSRILPARPDLLGLTENPGELSLESNDERLLWALRNGLAEQVSGLLRAMYTAGASIAEICDEPIRGAMQVIGEQWPHDKRAIFVEHRATMLCARALHQLRLSLRVPDEDAPKAVGCSPSGDPYLLPTMMVALALHECGFNEISLGPDTPLGVLADALEDERPALTWLSISTPIHSRSQQREIQELAREAKRQGSLFALGGRYADGVEFPPDIEVARCGSIGDINRLAAPLLKSYSNRRVQVLP